MKLAAGQSGRARVLVTAKAANQGINLPNVDMGVIVASPASILRRVQTLGRILRARREGGGLIPREAYGRYFPKTLHVIYVKGTADEEIYLQTDWDELLGRERNEWRVWAPDADAPVVDDQPPTPPMSEDEGVAWVREQLAAGATFPILWPTRLPPHQPLTFKHHHVRVTGEGGKVGRGSPVVANDAEIQRIVDGVAARRRLDPVALRGPLFVTVRDRLVLRIANEGLIDRPAVDPRSGRPLSPPLVVMGQLAALPVVTEAGAEPPDAELSRTEHPAPRPAPRGVPEPRGSNANLWVSAVAAFLDTGGAPNPEPPAAPPAVYTLLQDGARAARLPPVDRPMAARPEHLFAAWARAVALGDVAVAEAMETELGRRMAGEAREYALALRLVRAT